VLPGRLAGGLVETLVGRFPAPNGDGPGDVEVLVRPELVALTADPAGEGEVVSREFRGHDIFYRVRLGDGTTVCSQRPSNESIPLGARVALRPHAGRVALFH
jgi:TOBE domain